MPDQPVPDHDALPPRPTSCDSCGIAGHELSCVRRVYVTPEAWDTEEKVELAELEWWCDVCRTHYPHQVPA